MKLTVLLEPIVNNGFRARSGEPLVLSAEGPTRDEALRQLQNLVQNYLRTGPSLTEIEIPAENPWLRVAGMFENDSLFDSWQQALGQRRQELDADPDVP